MVTNGFIQDVKYALRSLASRPLYAVASIAVLAIAIGANTTVFSVFNGLFLRPLPYPNAERLMQPLTIFASGSLGSFSYPDFEDLRDQNRTFAGLAAYASRSASAAMGEQEQARPQAEPTREAVMFASILKGVHW